MSAKFNPITGSVDIALVSLPENFSYDYVPISITLIIPVYQQMLVCDTLEIVGSIILEGKICLI